MQQTSLSAFSLRRLLCGILFAALPSLAQETVGQDTSAAQAEHTTSAHTRRGRPIEPRAGDWKT